MSDNVIVETWEQPKGWRPRMSFDTPDKGPRPVPIGRFGVQKLVGRTIPIAPWDQRHSVQRNLGSYGMGGPGFFGLRLSGKSGGKPIWLVLRIWGADDWLSLDGVPLSDVSDGEMEALEGGVIKLAKVQPRYSQFQIGDRWLKFHSSPRKRPACDNGDERALGKGESLLDAWVVAKDMWLYV